MSGPNRLWSGDWMAESEAARARVSRGRDDVSSAERLETTEEHEVVRGPSRRSPRDLVLAAIAAVGATVQRLTTRARTRMAPRHRTRSSLRTRLVAIALLSGIVGAAAMIGLEAATGTGSPASATANRPYLGVELGSSILGQAGGLVEFVEPGSPAAAAGIIPGDVITSVGGRAVASPQDTQTAIAGAHAGEAITLGLNRFGQPLTVTVTLGTRPNGVP